MANGSYRDGVRDGAEFVFNYTAGEHGEDRQGDVDTARLIAEWASGQRRRGMLLSVRDFLTWCRHHDISP